MQCLFDSTIFFPHHLINGTEKVTENKLFLLSLQLMPKTFLILKRTHCDTIKKMNTDLHAELPLFLSDFDPT